MGNRRKRGGSQPTPLVPILHKQLLQRTAEVKIKPIHTLPLPDSETLPKRPAPHLTGECCHNATSGRPLSSSSHRHVGRPHCSSVSQQRPRNESPGEEENPTSPEAPRPLLFLLRRRWGRLRGSRPLPAARRAPRCPEGSPPHTHTHAQVRPRRGGEQGAREGAFGRGCGSPARKGTAGPQARTRAYTRRAGARTTIRTDTGPTRPGSRRRSGHTSVGRWGWQRRRHPTWTGRQQEQGGAHLRPAGRVEAWRTPDWTGSLGGRGGAGTRAHRKAV